MRYIWDNVWTVLVILTFITVFKTALNIGVIRLLGESWPRAFLSGVLLAQIGEFSFVLAALGLAVGAVSHEAQRLIVAVTVLSLMFGPLWLFSARRFHTILLLGVTSARETLRLAYGKEAAFLFRPITPLRFSCRRGLQNPLDGRRRAAQTALGAPAVPCPTST